MIVYVVLVTFARGANVDNVYQDYTQAWDRVDELRNNGFEATVRGRDIIANVQEALNLAKEQAGVIGAWSIEKMMGECHVPSAK